ncbi:DUF6531 domain-containing protein [Streptomyces sp. NPDC093261]|uniref:DUF6531 domain-containing protein n=1 Tax=Streptomyces sp. NPDC093261 TaxID=3366037 RepID=UPI003820D2EA
MSGQISHALEDVAKKTEQALARDFSKAYHDILKETQSGAMKVADRVAKQEAEAAKDLENIAKGRAGDLPVADPHLPNGGGREPDLGAGRRGGGQGVEGNSGCQTGGDPVDVVSGQMITSATDLDLPGLLRLVLRRAYASGYQGGTLFGPGWSATLTQRLQIDHQQIHYAGEDGQVLHYPVPGPGQHVLPEDGARWPLSWDRGEDVIRIDDPVNGSIRHFPALPQSSGIIRPLAALTDRNGHRIEFVHDDDGLPVEVRQSGGRRVAVDAVQTAVGPRIEELRLLDGSNRGAGTTVVGFRYDIRGRLTDIINSSGRPLIYEYDERNRITSWTDRNGHSYTYVYGADDRVAHGRGPNGALDADFSYDTVNRRTTVTNSQGARTEYYYDEHRHLTRITGSLGHTVRLEHDRYGRLLSYTDPLGHTTRNTFDARGDVVRVDRPDGTSLQIAYNELRLPVEITTPEGRTWRQAYDERGNRTEITDRAGVTTRFTYDELGCLTGVTNAFGSTTQVRCDPHGLLAEALDPLGGRTEYQRDAFGRPIAITDPLGNTSRYHWTVEGRLLARTQPGGTSDAWAYDPEGNLLRHTDPAGATTELEYTHFHLIAARTEPDGTRYTFTHDTELRLTEVTQPQGLTWNYTYDATGRLVSETDFDGRTIGYAYDAAGQLTECRNGLGQAIRYTLDPLGRIVAKDADGELTQYRYDQTGQLLSARNTVCELTRRYDPVGRILAETVDGRTIEFTYDELGNLATRRTPSGSLSTWSYDPAGKPLSLTAAGQQLAFEHDAVGRETARHLGPDLTLAFAWDATNRLTAQTLTGTDAQALLRRSYHYRADSALTALTDHALGKIADTTHYELDRAGRVTAVHATDWTEHYAYDQGGHPLEAIWPSQRQRDAAAQGQREYQGSLLRRAGHIAYDYDGQGRITGRRQTTLSGRTRTWHYTWDAEDRLTEVTTPDGSRWTYRYDPLGRRISKQHLVDEGAAWTVRERTEFTWAGAVLVEQTAYASSLPAPYTLSWDYRGLHPITQAERIGTGHDQEDIDRRFFAIITDLVGTPTHLIAPDGSTAWQQRSNLWGLQIAASRHATDTPLRFPGQYYDPESRLHYNVFRYYDPVAARYLSSDPLGLSPAPDAYGYVGNPLLACDPFGLTMRDARGRYMHDPNAAPVTHNRDSEYPSGYRQSTHDAMVQNWTDEGLAQGTAHPVDAAGNPILREQLTWRDSTGQVVPYDQLTYEHLDPVVNHWNTTGYNTDRPTRNDFYNDPANLEPMTRSQNSSGGARLGQTYRQDVGPNYRCT